jgi:predicted nucleic acid-binding protein
MRQTAAVAEPAKARTSPVDQRAMEALRKTTHSALAALTPHEAEALRARFGIDLSAGHTLESVGKQFDVTRERIKSREREGNLSSVVDQFLTRVSCLPWDAAAATHFATVAFELHNIGTPMGTADTMIVGHAIAVGAVLVTSGEPRFLRVAGLKTENWMRRRSTQ